MTEAEHDAELNRVLRDYADNERAIACRRERLRTVWSALHDLNLNSGNHPPQGELEKAEKAIVKLGGNLLEDLAKYRRHLISREHLAKALRNHGYGALVGD